MDSNRRHQLAQNSLAYWVTKQYEEWILPNGRWIGIVAIALVVLLVAFVGSARFVDSMKADAWRQFYYALNNESALENLKNLAESNDSVVGTQSRLTLAQLQLADGCNLAFTDKVKAAETLENAVQNFQILQKGKSSPEVEKMAVFGLAEAYEALAYVRDNKTDLAQAEAEYKKANDRYPDDYWGKMAGEKLSLLARADTKSFYELTAAKASEQPATEDFKVEIDTKDPFTGGPGGFDPQSALGDRLDSTFADTPAKAEEQPASESEEPAPAPPAKPSEEQPAEETKSE